MKLSLFFVAILGVSAVAAVPAVETVARSTRSLSDDWADFYALLDTEAMLEVFYYYVANDAEVQACIEYLKSDTFKNMLLDFEAIPGVMKVMNYLQDKGLDVYGTMNRFHAWLGLDELVAPGRSIPASRLVSARYTGGLAGLWADIKDLLPLADLSSLYDKKLQTSTDFAEFINMIKSPEAVAVYDQIKNNPDYQKMRAGLVNYGLDMDYFFGWVKDFIGFD